ncbi:MAG TPA: hypothetical protein VFK05_02660 [Polyangiaceae bacterium]|nr:hypothetical protein [Polyangiaceae bacterium]
MPRATLLLRSGAYYFDSYEVDPLATVVVDESAGPVELYVEKSLVHMGTYRTPRGSTANVFVGYFGSLPAFVGAAFPGTVLAPGAKLVIGLPLGGGTHVGAFYARNIEVMPFTKILHRPTDHFGIGDGNAIAPTLTSSSIDPVPDPSFAPSFLGTLSADSEGNPVYERLSYATPDPEHGVVAPSFCDAHLNPVEAPSEAELNTPPPPSAMCPAVAANSTNCPVDPDTLAGPCATDADCGAGFVCSAQCADAACLTVLHRCGKQAASCAGLPQESDCEEYTLCPREGAVGSPNLEKVSEELTPMTTPGPDAVIDPSERTALPKYAAISADLCEEAAEPVVTTRDVSQKSAGDGSKEWGFYLDPKTDFGIGHQKSSTFIPNLTDLHASAGVAVGAIVFKKKVELVSANAKAIVDNCGVTLVSTVKLFGDAIATWTPSEAQKLHLVTQSDGSVGTPPADGDACRASRQATYDAQSGVRLANLFAREVLQYYQTHGMNRELCDTIVEALHFEKKNEPKPSSCPGPDPETIDCSQIEHMSPALKLDILNAWKGEYKCKIQTYVDFANALKVKQQAIQTTGAIHIFDAKDGFGYHFKLFDLNFPIGPVTLKLATDAFGAWNVSGAILYGIGVDGNFTNAVDLLKNSMNGQVPRVGDIRAYGGPDVTPAARQSILVFVGAGVPGVSVGIDGEINLLDLSVPSAIVAAAMRLSAPDDRPLDGTPYAGSPVTSMEPTKYRWVTGFSWSSGVKISTMSGRMDLAARLHFLGFKKTLRVPLFSWPAQRQWSFPIVGGGTEDPLKYSGDYGELGDDMAFTEVPAITDDPPKTSDSQDFLSFCPG